MTGERTARDRPLVLVGERDPFMRRTLSRTLGEHVDLDFAESGVDLAKKARRIRPDVIVLEVLLPEKDGLQLCRELKEDPELRGTPVVIFSLLDVEDRALQAGAAAFVGKPLRKEELLNAIWNALERDAEEP